jgi:dTDP-4-dehydrorhamnose reductase
MKSYFPKILITGCNGQIGSALESHPHADNFHVIACDRTALDITQPISIHDAITQFTPDIIINTAAYTAVDKAESDEEAAMLINHLGAKNLAMACTQHHIPLIHLSTDYIFDGNKSSPYLEHDTANPLNVYGKSKWLGEQAVREHCREHIILRVSAVFSEYGRNFMQTVLRLGSERKELNIVADQMTCPTYAGNIAGVIYTLCENLKSFGTYHYCDAPSASWHEFASAIIEKAALPVEKIHAITTSEYKTPAKRPLYSVLDCSKLKLDYGIQQAEWMQEIERCVG